MEDITDADYRNPKKSLNRHNSHVQSDTVLLAYVFGNFWNMCLEIYVLDAVRFLTAPGLARQTANWDYLLFATSVWC